MDTFASRIHKGLLLVGMVVANLSLLASMIVSVIAEADDRLLASGSLMAGALAGIIVSIWLWWGDWNTANWKKEAKGGVLIFGVLGGIITGAVESLTSGSTFYIWGGYLAFVLAQAMTFVYCALAVENEQRNRVRGYTP